MYLTQALHRMARCAPQALAVVDATESWTWAELAGRTALFAGALRRLGVGPGERVGLLSRNGGRFLEYVVGTVWAGGVVNPVNLRWTAEEMGYSLADCDTGVLLVEPAFEPLLPVIRRAAPGIQHVLSTGAPAGADAVPYADWMGGAGPVGDALRRDGDLAAILYTGGTTGRSKGVMLSHANLVGSALGTLATPGCSPREIFLHSAPLFHIGALSGAVIALVAGSTSAFIPAFEPLAFLQAVERWRVSDTFLAPTMLKMVVDHPRLGEFDTASLGLIRYGAAPMDDALLDRAIAAFPNAGFCQAYGMTELSPTCCLLGPEDHSVEALASGRGRSAGRATPVCEVRVVDPSDEELAPGAVGEIIVRGPTVMTGYWNRPEATAEALRGGWMHTGDLGRMDEAGYLTIVDRLKDMIITGGENVYSAEVENVLYAHPQVAAAAVIGLPDAHWGERVHAVIVLRPGAEPDPASIKAHCRAALAAYKTPRSMAFVESLPLSGAGKVLKAELRRAQLARPERT